MSKASKATAILSNAGSGDFSTNRRMTLVLVVATLTGMIARSARAGGELGNRARASGVSAASAIRGSGARDAASSMASQFRDLKELAPEHRVRAIRFRHNAFLVMTADGQSTVFQETALRFRVDSSELGPNPGDPVILPAGRMGDRAWLFFASPEEIGTFIKHQS